MKNQEKQNIKNLLNQLDTDHSRLLNKILLIEKKANEERLKAKKEYEKIGELMHTNICNRMYEKRNQNAEEIEKLTLELKELEKKNEKELERKNINEKILLYCKDKKQALINTIGYKVLLLINEKCKSKSDLIAFNSLLKYEENNFSFYITYNYGEQATINFRETNVFQYLYNFDFCKYGNDFFNLSKEVFERITLYWLPSYQERLNTFVNDYEAIYKAFEEMKKLQEKQEKETNKLFKKHCEEREKKDTLKVYQFINER